MKVLVTGITGFIGSELAHRILEEGHEIKGLVRHVVGRDFEPIKDIKNKIDIIPCDFKDFYSVRSSIKKANPDVVMHLGALSPVRLSFEHPLEYQNSNYLSTINIAESIRDLYGPEKVRLIAASTAEVYGMQEETPFGENLKLEPSSPYAVSKASMDIYLRMLSKVYDFNGVILRNSNTFGRKYDSGFFTEYLITNMLKGDEVYVGAENSVRDYMYVEDHVNSYLLAMKTPEAKGQAFNISGGVGYSNKEWTLKIADMLGFSKEKIHFGEYPPGYPNRPLSSDQPYLVLDSSKAQKILGWKQTVSIDEGLKKTIEHWKKRK
ncbi:MAG: GDP-mannose 4,6-dehydratase [Nanoarchaeota archaeon]|nr:GDP-mannose 4,6-dehydratase [Nanoarchaeota archaeon]